MSINVRTIVFMVQKVYSFMTKIKGKNNKETLMLRYKTTRIRLTAIITLSWNIRGDINTQNISYTNAQLRRADATCTEIL